MSLPRRILLAIGAVVAAVLVAALVLALWPESTSELTSEPRPIGQYDAALAAFERVQADERSGVIPVCRSRLLTHGEKTERAIALVHGLTSCPEQFAELGREFYKRGWNVLILRLPHHGIGDPGKNEIGSVSNLDGLTAKELAGYGDRSVDITRGLGDKVTVMGLSTGGVVTAWVGERRADVERAVVIAPAIGIAGIPYAATWMATNLFGHLPGITLPAKGDVAYVYQGWSTKGLAETFLLGKAVRQWAARDRPRAGSLVLVVNPNDKDVSNTVARGVAQDWRKHDAKVRIYQLPNRPKLQHDIIDPHEPWARPAFVYPRLIRLVEAQ